LGRRREKKKPDGQGMPSGLQWRSPQGKGTTAAYYHASFYEALELLDVEAVEPFRTLAIALEVAYRPGKVDQEYETNDRCRDHE
jgi:hypothetical protein